MADAEQLTLAVPVKASWCETASFGTADCSQVCRCDDGSDYAIKDDLEVAAVPHSEWFCTHLGELVGLASPPCKIVDVQGKACFGSRWETGHNARDWILRAQDGRIDFASLAPTLLRIYAFDLFVNNVDRHTNNYIVREQHFGTALLAFDYSRAWIVNGMPPPNMPMSSSHNTVQFIKGLRTIFGDFFQQNEADHVLDKLESTPVQAVDKIISSHPQEWLTKSQHNAILSWWKSDIRTSRISDIRKGVKDGEYL
ncbi:HipA family kinase [Sphingomonas sp. PAMC 26617]|uniref:HipA family kinase n=1 Tax=Sphingomonas sp. PAMC 26617 TaxID=1112216 RepID=UPI000289A6AE|nr:HipA family kinase [Sphingomonas sp. PAMC 26617]